MQFFLFRAKTKYETVWMTFQHFLSQSNNGLSCSWIFNYVINKRKSLIDENCKTLKMNGPLKYCNNVSSWSNLIRNGWCLTTLREYECLEMFSFSVMQSTIRFTYVKAIMYQSNRSFNIPSGTPGQPPGHLNFWKFLFKFPPHRAEKLFKCPHPRENYQITVLTFQ